jgi:trimeric autotransporter adhesin
VIGSKRLGLGVEPPEVSGPSGDGTFQPAVNYAAGNELNSIASDDFNGDGKLDLVASSFNESDVSILLGNGDGTFQAPMNFNTNTQQSASAVAVGDFNRDGRLDLAVADYSGPGVSVLLQTTTATLFPPSLNFNTQQVGSTSAAQILTFANTGDLTLDIASISVTGTNASDFGETNSCPSNLAGGANCIINVTFSPSQEGPFNASVSVSNNSAGSPQTAALTGLGLASGANVSPSPGSLTFPGQLLNTASASMPVTLTNYGTIPVNISSIAASTNFAEAQACPASLAPLASCTINVTFTPSAAGNLMGTLAVTDDAPGSPQKIALSGIGAMPTTATLIPDSMEFFCRPLHLLIGGCTPPQNATLTNTGNATLYLYGVTLTSATGYFSTTNNCPTQLEPGQSCIITVSFGAPIPRNQAMYSATLVVNDTASNPQQIALTGTASPD